MANSPLTAPNSSGLQSVAPFYMSTNEGSQAGRLLEGQTDPIAGHRWPQAPAAESIKPRSRLQSWGSIWVLQKGRALSFSSQVRIWAGDRRAWRPVSWLFNLAKEDAAGYEAYAEQLAAMFKGNRKLLEDVLEGLFHIAWADNILHPREEQFLAQVAKRFGFADTEFSYIKARHGIAPERNPYEVLGVTPSISNGELKSHYHSLIIENHPDKLLGRGVPKEFIVIATKKVAAINEAYGAITKERGI